jgi:hypothetical protein
MLNMKRAESFGKRGEWYISEGELMSDGKPVPTVSEILKASKEEGVIILMDAKSAAEGVKRLEREIEDLKAMREAFTTFSKNYVPDTAGAFNGNANKLSEGEISALIGRIAQEEEAKRQEREREQNPRVYDKGADVNAAANETGANDKPKMLSFNTPIGLMECVGGDNVKPELTRPSNAAGEMFAKIDRLFDRISKNLTTGRIDESNVMTRMVVSNADLTRKTAAAA